MDTNAAPTGKALTGKIKNFIVGKRFGFIEVNPEIRSIFFHIRHWNSLELPKIGDEVSFVLAASTRSGFPDEAYRIQKITLSALDVLSGISGDVSSETK